MSNSRLLKQGQDVSMQDTITTAKTKLGHTKPSTGPHGAAGRGLDVAELTTTTVGTTEYIFRCGV